MTFLWFFLTLTTFFALMGNNINVIIDKNYVRRMDGRKLLGFIIGHAVAYIVCYNALMQLIDSVR